MSKELEKRISELEKELANEKCVSESKEQYGFQCGESTGILKGVFSTLTFVVALGIGGYFIDKCDCTSGDSTEKTRLKKPKDNLIDTVQELYSFLGISKEDSKRRKKEIILAFQEQCHYNLGLKAPKIEDISKEKQNLDFYVTVNIINNTPDLLKKLRKGTEYHDWVTQTIKGYHMKIPKIAIENAKELAKERKDLDIIIDYKDPLIRKLARWITRDSKTDEEKAEKILGFVQAIPYTHDVGRDYGKHPL